jgi:hypothetical protein
MMCTQNMKLDANGFEVDARDVLFTGENPKTTKRHTEMIQVDGSMG